MERIDPDNDSPVIIGEHIHRYEWAASLCYGSVLDISCGVGYGSTVILSSAEVHQYCGVDIHAPSIEYAVGHYSKHNAVFKVGNCSDIPVPSNSQDCVVSLETLEHLEEPNLAIQEYKRVLKTNGLLIGSVPSKEYDSLCEGLYGPNPYHVQQFDQNALTKLLGNEFDNILFFESSLHLVSLLTGPGRLTLNLQDDTLPAERLGSILFIASTRDDLKSWANRVYMGNFSGLRFITHQTNYDRIYVTPKRQTIDDLEAMVRERDLLIHNQDELIADRDRALIEQQRMIEERDELIRKQDDLIRSRDQTMRDQEEMIIERDAVIRHQDTLVKSRDEALAAQEQMINERDTLLREQERLLALRDDMVHRLEIEVQSSSGSRLSKSLQRLRDRRKDP